MIVKNTKYCKLIFFDNYVIAESTTDLVQNACTVKEVLKVMAQHFEGRPFIIISNRVNNYTIAEDAYSPRLFRKVQGFAVVSKSPLVKEKAIAEQLKFEHSFAFFENLDDAQNWASSFSPS